MKRVIIEKRITHQRCLDLVVWALANDIPIIEICATRYNGRKGIVESYRFVGRKGIVKSYRLVDPSVMQIWFDWKLCVREQDADLVLMRL